MTVDNRPTTIRHEVQTPEEAERLNILAKEIGVSGMSTSSTDLPDGPIKFVPQGDGCVAGFLAVLKRWLGIR